MDEVDERNRRALESLDEREDDRFEVTGDEPEDEEEAEPCE